MSKIIRLGVYYHGLIHYDGNRTYSYSPSFLFLKGLKKYGFHISSICSSVKKINSPMTISPVIMFENEGIDVFALPTWNRMTELIRKLPYQTGIIKETLRSFVASSDIFWIRAPTAILGFILREIHHQHKPVVIHMAGNLRDSWRSTKHTDLTRSSAKVMGELLHRRSFHLLKNELLLATGPELVKLFYRKERKVIPFVDSMLSSLSLASKAKVQASRLLFVGRIDHGKGLFEILKTMQVLKNQAIRFPLTIIGEGPLLDLLKKQSLNLGLSDLITWKGFIAPGEKLDAEYRQNDILLIPSESTEGVPRVLLEAWSQGLLVVGSKVGGLGSLIKHGENGLLVEPGNAESLTEAILRLFSEPSLREKLLQGGYASIPPYTYRRQLAIAAHTLQKAGFPFSSTG